ncbi:hypothetical protein GW17_00009869 [Ensete ventricosum]|nr:hypothetical protein GW17_00009869 [Ensete ventricosum]
MRLRAVGRWHVATVTGTRGRRLRGLFLHATAMVAINCSWQTHMRLPPTSAWAVGSVADAADLYVHSVKAEGL